MQTFKSKDGRLIHPMPHKAIFKGKRNSSKGKTLIILNHHNTRFLTAKQIHDYTGVNLDYLQARLSFWYNIRFINRKAVTPARGRPYWSYQIAERGKTFINVRMPVNTRNKYIQEINDWNATKKLLNSDS